MPNETATTQGEDRALELLLGIVQQANSPDVWEAQNILLRRLALQGDVVGSRVPAPRNITEIGGYLNYLGELQQSEMRAQALAGILGVAGPNPPLGWVASHPALSMVSISNDRPEGAAQPGIPLSVSVRSDFAAPLQAAVKAVHERGCFLPLLTVPCTGLPGEPPEDFLPCLGRVLDLFPGSALLDPATDVLALARSAGSTGEFQVVARALSAGTVPVTPADWEVLQCTESGSSSATLNAAPLLSLGPFLASAGYYPASPLPLPATSLSTAWARLTNLTGLVPGRTQLGDELSLLYAAAAVADSGLSACLHWTWNGSTFREP